MCLFDAAESYGSQLYYEDHNEEIADEALHGKCAKVKTMTTLTWFGTNSFLLETPGTSLLVDPFLGMPGAEHPLHVHDFTQAGTRHAVRDILITHCHFDHLSSVPAILAEHPAVVYCTECGIPALKAAGCSTENVIVISPGDEFAIDDIQVKVYQGRHIHFDSKLVRETLAPSHLASNAKNLPQIIRLSQAYREKHETLVYELTGKSEADCTPIRMVFLGSLSLDATESYPTGADYLVLPYQGSSHLVDFAREVIRQLEPKCVIASHFDNSFPPISQRVGLSELKRLMVSEFPQVKLIIPRFKEPINLSAQDARA